MIRHKPILFDSSGSIPFSCCCVNLPVNIPVGVSKWNLQKKGRLARMSMYWVAALRTHLRRRYYEV